MAAFELPCPQCGKQLKVPDRAMLGRRARCGKCGFRFVLAEPVELLSVSPAELVEFQSIEPSSAGSEKTLLGLGARWVENRSPPAPAPVVPSGAAAAAPPSETDGLHPFEALDLAPADEPDEGPVIRRPYPGPRRSRTVWVVGGLAALIAVVAAAAFLVRDGKTSKQRVAHDRAAIEPEDGDNRPALVDRRKRKTEAHPITLKHLPSGARILIHLRPAELWRAGSTGEEVRACLGPLGVWGAQQLTAKCLIDPARIEEALVALIPVSRENFAAAAVVRTTDAVRRSELLDTFDGELIDEPRQHYVNDEQVLLLVDKSTYALAPKEMKEALLEAADGSGLTSEGIQALLPATDRGAHLVILGELDDLRTGAAGLAPDNVQDLLRGLLDFAGDDVETFAWSVRLGDAGSQVDLTSEIVLRNRLSRSPAGLLEDVQARFAELPAEVLQIVRQTDPALLGQKKVVGRLPAMLKVAEQSARYSTGNRRVTLTFTLPERAAPNLALGALLAWNETTLPAYRSGSVTSARAESAGAGLPATIAERLKKRIDVEFRDDFLYVAIDYVGEETGVKFRLDGPGMKLASVTQNEKQKFTMQGVPATAVLDRILTPRKLVLIVDEQTKTAVVTSADDAANRKLTPFALSSGDGR